MYVPEKRYVIEMSSYFSGSAFAEGGVSSVGAVVITGLGTGVGFTTANFTCIGIPVKVYKIINNSDISSHMLLLVRFGIQEINIVYSASIINSILSYCHDTITHKFIL